MFHIILQLKLCDQQSWVLSVRFCSVEEHASYKAAVSFQEPAEANLPLAQPVKTSWRIYIIYRVGVLQLVPELAH